MSPIDDVPCFPVFVSVHVNKYSLLFKSHKKEKPHQKNPKQLKMRETFQGKFASEIVGLKR